MTSQFASVSGAGMPVDTPVLYFPSPGLLSIDLATGLSYPAKAERARRNPRVGLWIEGGADEPVISIAGMAAVRDADLQANAERYISEAGYTLAHNPTWELARQAVWYWTRMLVEVRPARVLWWENPAALGQPPQSWQAPSGTIFPQSDPAPPGKTSSPARWELPGWQELARRALERGDACHLTVLDPQGYPLPFRVSNPRVTAEGFAIDLPGGIGWPVAGNACLTFRGIETFLGEVHSGRGKASLRVHRTLPVFPMTLDMTQLWEPTAHTRAELMARLEHETKRRGQPVPHIPEERPAPTAYYRMRMARLQGRTSPGGQTYEAIS